MRKPWNISRDFTESEKVANCVCLFGLHHIDAFPVDTWIEKILMEQYYDRKNTAASPKTVSAKQS